QVWNEEESLAILIAAASLALEGLVGWMGQPILHASLAAVVFAILVAAAVITSPGWSGAPKLVEDEAAATLRFFAIATPALIVLQIILGAAYRHKRIGLLPHLGGAMVISLPILALGMLILQRHSEHRKLSRAATWLIAMFLMQVMLGIAAFVMP